MTELKTLKCGCVINGNEVIKLCSAHGRTEKLKTLKDIEKRDIYGSFVNSGKLRQEAIKDVNEFKLRKAPFAIIAKFDKPLTKSQLNAIIEYIKWKNNITEEDLKEDKSDLVTIAEGGIQYKEDLK